MATATLLFAVGLVLGRPLPIWVTTGVAALLSLVLCWRIAQADLRPRLRPSSRGLVLGVAAAATLTLATYAVFPVAKSLVPELEHELTRLYTRLADWPGPLAASPLLVLVVFAEEVAWRGVLVSALERLFQERRAAIVVVAAVLYALPQLGAESWLMLPVALGCGLVWTATRLASGELTAPLLAHLGWDLWVFVIHPLA